jgi:hypothetical protein
MNSELENQLEAEIDRQLKDLPDLVAPPNLVPRLINAVTRPPAPWHVRPWYAWPAGLRAASVILALAMLAGAIPGWRAIEPGLVGPMVTRLANWKAGLDCLWNAAGALAGAGTVILAHLGRGILLSCVALVALAYAACVGFGTVFVRLAWSKPRKNLL